MRDDAASMVSGLVRLYTTKLQLLNALLLSESDKLHYCRSGNLEKAMEIIGTDGGVIDDIDAVDFDIAKEEASLASLVGTRRKTLYDILRGSGDAVGLIAAREQVHGTVKTLFEKRKELLGLMETASEEIRNSIDDLSRLSRLKEAGGADDGRSGR
ncbi:MAG: hypothetical protein KA369_11345 [Spirochaetes bacterium]|nr:hypothetical protein [Spirochaetota bacterium]